MEEERLTDIEIKLAHLETTQDSLDTVVITLQDKIDFLINKLKSMENQLGEIRESNIDDGDEKPPHY